MHTHTYTHSCTGEYRLIESRSLDLRSHQCTSYRVSLTTARSHIQFGNDLLVDILGKEHIVNMCIPSEMLEEALISFSRGGLVVRSAMLNYQSVFQSITSELLRLWGSCIRTAEGQKAHVQLRSQEEVKTASFSGKQTVTDKYKNIYILWSWMGEQETVKYKHG